MTADRGSPTRLPLRLSLAAALGAAFCTGVLAAAPAEAGDRAARGANARPHAAQPRWESKQVERSRTADGRQRTTTWTGPEGKTATRTDDTTRTDDGYTRSSVFTGPDGKTATREADVSFDKEAGTRTREVTATGPNGQTRTVSDVTTRTDDGYNRETVVNNPNGSTLTRTATGSYDEETSTWTRSVTTDRDPPPAE